MNVGKCDLTLSTEQFTFCLIKMKATSQVLQVYEEKTEKFQEY
jgi:hypothetical protein